MVIQALKNRFSSGSGRVGASDPQPINDPETNPDNKWDEGKSNPYSRADLQQASKPQATAGDTATNPARVKDLDFVPVDFNHEDLKGSKNAAKILKSFGITEGNSNGEKATALMCPTADHIFVIADGPTSRKAEFNNTIPYKLTGGISRRIFGARDKAAAIRWENAEEKKANEGDAEAKTHEPLSHIIKSLKKDEYHTVTVFARDPQTGDFFKDPAAVALVDNYKGELKAACKHLDGDLAREVKDYMKTDADLEGYYATTQYLHNPKQELDNKRLTTMVAEALSQSRPDFKELIVHYKVHDKAFSLAKHANGTGLSYQSFPAAIPYRTNSGELKKSDTQHPLSQLTFVRKDTDAGKPLDIFSTVAHTFVESCESGKAIKVGSADCKLFNEALQLNLDTLRAHNSQIS